MNEHTDEIDSPSNAASLVESLLAENNRFQEELKALKQQQDSLNAAMTMVISSRDEEIANLKRKFNEEIASYQRLMEEAVEAAIEECNHDWQTRFNLMEDQCIFLKKQTEELKQRLKVTAEMARHCTNQNNQKPAGDDSHLRSIIEPMEQEIDCLKKQLKSAERKLSTFGFSTFTAETSTDRVETGEQDKTFKDESIGELVGVCEQLECYKIQLELERKHREEIENKLSECALTHLSESAKQQCKLDELERHVQTLELMYGQLSLASEARITELLEKCHSLECSSVNKADSGTALAKMEARLEAERLRHRRTAKQLAQYEEELVLMRSIESEYRRLMERNKELEAECVDLKKQIEVSQQATFRAISTIRSEVERRCKEDI